MPVVEPAPPSRRANFTSLSTWCLLAAICVLTAGAYWSGLSGPFVFDDYNNIVGNPGVRIPDWSIASLWQATLAGDAGPLKRPLSMLSFALNYLFTGFAPFPFKLTNLCIHLINGFLVYLLSRRLVTILGAPVGISGDRIALVAAGVWMLHPAQLTSVLYVVQRMTSLSATFVLIGLLVYLQARNLAVPHRQRLWRLWIAFPFCMLLAALAKENGVLVIAFAFVLEITALHFRTLPGERWGTPQQFFALTLALPLYGILIFLWGHPEWFDRAAQNRSFTTIERLMTEARVMVLYLKILLVPAISSLAMFYDDFRVSRGLLAPASTLWSLLALVVAFSSAVWLRRRAPWYAFAVLWFLAGHAMESTIIMLELIHPHRNYVPYLGPMLAISVGAASVFSRTYRWMPATVAFFVVLALAGTTALRAQQWRNPLDLAVYEVRHRPESSRANYEVARLLNIAAQNTGNDELNQDAIRYLQRSAELDPTDISALIGIAIASGGPMDTAVLTELRSRLTRRPMPPNQVSYLQALITCQRERKCQTPPEQLQAIFSALLSHPQLRPTVKADALTILGIYYAEQLQDFAAARTLMQEAISLRPQDPVRYLNLTRVLLFVPDMAAAEKALLAAEREDSLGAHQRQIARIRQDIVTIESRLKTTAPPGPPVVAN